MSTGHQCHTLASTSTVDGASFPARIRVAVVDDRPMTRAGVEQVVAGDHGLHLVASVPEVDDLRRARTRCDVVLIMLPTVDVGQALEMVSTAAGIGRALVTSTWERRPTVLGVLRAGARGCLTRQSPSAALVDGVRIVGQGGIYLCAELVDQLRREMGQARPDVAARLAPREIETLRWIAWGYTQMQIATRMGLTEATINTYAKRIRRKLEVGNKAQLTRIAVDLGYLEDGPRDDAA